MTSTGRRSGQGFDEAATIADIRELAAPLENERDLDLLLDRIGDARYVLIGEASHGTSEFYQWRALLTRRLIAERGFSFVGVEGDWPDCHRLNRYVNSAYTRQTVNPSS